MATLFHYSYLLLCFGTLCLASRCIDYNYDKAYFFSSTLTEYLSPELRGKNFFVSPIGAYLTLTALSYGTSGETEIEFCKILRRPDERTLRRGLLSILSNITDYTSNSFSISSQILVPDDVNVSENFINSTRSNFLTSIVTNHSPGLVHTSNSVDFKGTWYWKFRKTRDIGFHVNHRLQKSVKAVYLENYFDLGYLPEFDAKFIIIPFNVTDLDMVIITPTHIDRTFVIEDSLSQIVLNDLLEAKKFRDRCELYLPTFRFEDVTISLGTALQRMWLERVFSSYADLSGISDSPLRVGDVLQRFTMEVSEEGQFVPEIIIDNEPISYPGVPIKKFIVDRPSVIAIRYQKHYLLIGRLNDPTAV